MVREKPANAEDFVRALLHDHKRGKRNGLIRDLEHSDCKFFFQEETQPKIEPAIRSQAFPAVF